VSTTTPSAAAGDGAGACDPDLPPLLATIGAGIALANELMAAVLAAEVAVPRGNGAGLLRVVKAGIPETRVEETILLGIRAGRAVATDRSNLETAAPLGS